MILTVWRRVQTSVLILSAIVVVWTRPRNYCMSLYFCIYTFVYILGITTLRLYPPVLGNSVLCWVTLPLFQRTSLWCFLRPRTHGNVSLRFCIVSSDELVVLDSLENGKQYKNAGKRFRCLWLRFQRFADRWHRHVFFSSILLTYWISQSIFSSI